MRKSLEQIIVERTSTHLERGTNGISKQVTRTYKQKLEVRTINGGLRFVHLIVDYFIIYTIIYLLDLIPWPSTMVMSIMGLIVLLSYPLYYALAEYKFQQTLGKMLTKSVVINEFAESPSLSTCLLRTLIRFVPFEAFSCLGSPSRGWHDRWAKTYVVHKDEVPKLKALIAKHNPEAIPVS